MKYTPKVEDLSIRLFACIKTKTALLVQCGLAIHLDEGPPGDDKQHRLQYQRIIEATNALSQTRSNAEDLEDARASLSLAMSSHASLQKTSAANRSGRACFEGAQMVSDELTVFLDAVVLPATATTTRRLTSKCSRATAVHASANLSPSVRYPMPCRHDWPSSACTPAPSLLPRGSFSEKRASPLACRQVGARAAAPACC